MTEKKLIYYQTEDDKEPFVEWFESFKDKVIQARIDTRLERVTNGNYGDHKAVGSGVFELRYHFGSGYRVYFAEDGDTLVLLLTGGDKSSQKKDVELEKVYLQDYLDNKKEDTNEKLP